jgi:hypothetical protein
MPSSKSRVSRRKEFSEPIILNASHNDAGRISRILNERLDLFCEDVGIKERNSNRYRHLCLILLRDFMGVRGFQVVTSRPKRVGAPVKWTVQRHLDLVEFIDNVSSDKTFKQAVGMAKNKLGENTEGSIRAEYYRAKRFFDKAPRRVVQAMLAMRPESKLAEFFADGGYIPTSYGIQRVGQNRIGRVVRDLPKSTKP